MNHEISVYGSKEIFESTLKSNLLSLQSQKGVFQGICAYFLLPSAQAQSERIYQFILNNQRHLCIDDGDTSRAIFQHLTQLIPILLEMPENAYRVGEIAATILRVNQGDLEEVRKTHLFPDVMALLDLVDADDHTPALMDAIVRLVGNNNDHEGLFAEVEEIPRIQRACILIDTAMLAKEIPSLSDTSEIVSAFRFIPPSKRGHLFSLAKALCKQISLPYEYMFLPLMTFESIEEEEITAVLCAAQQVRAPEDMCDSFIMTAAAALAKIPAANRGQAMNIILMHLRQFPQHQRMAVLLTRAILMIPEDKRNLENISEYLSHLRAIKKESDIHKFTLGAFLIRDEEWSLHAVKRISRLSSSLDPDKLSDVIQVISSEAMALTHIEEFLGAYANG